MMAPAGSAADTVLLDLTALDTPSRFRGTGRYVRALTRGLAALDRESLAGLRLLGLTKLGWDGSFEVTEDLDGFQGHLDFEPTDHDYVRMRYKRRLWLWHVARECGVSLVHLPDPSATPLLRSFGANRWVATCLDLIPLRYPDRYFGWRDGWGAIGKRISRRRFTSADHVIAISDATRDDLVALLGMDAARITTTPIGCDLDRWRCARREPDAATVRRYGLVGQSYLLYVGDADWRKNTEGMIAGLARARALGADVELAMAGVLSGERAQRVDRIAKDHGVGAQVHRIGYVHDDDLPALYRCAIAHIFVSRLEGFGLTVIEAMAAGCPVITTRAGSLAEVAGDAAQLVDPEDADAIGHAVAPISAGAELRAQLVERGRVQAEKFTFESQARTTLVAYRKALARV